MRFALPPRVLKDIRKHPVMSESKYAAKERVVVCRVACVFQVNFLLDSSISVPVMHNFPLLFSVVRPLEVLTAE